MIILKPKLLIVVDFGVFSIVFFNKIPSSIVNFNFAVFATVNHFFLDSNQTVFCLNKLLRLGYDLSEVLSDQMCVFSFLTGEN